MKGLVLLSFLLLLPYLVSCAQPAAETPADTLSTSSPDSVAATSQSASPTWLTFDEALSAAEESGKVVLIDVYAPWCGWCRKMQKEVYTDAALNAYLSEHFEMGRLNIDDAETKHTFKGYEISSKELGYGLGAEGTPTTIFLEPNGDYITRLPGYQNLATFSQVLRYIGTDAFRTTSFQEFVEQEGIKQTN